MTAVELDDWNRAVSAAAAERYEFSILPNWISDSGNQDKLANSGVLELFVADAKGRTSAQRTVVEGTEAAFAQAALGHVARLLSIAEAEVPISPDNPFG